MTCCNQNSQNQKYEKLEEMPNIGKVAAVRLREAGIETPKQLCAVGSKEALLRLRERDPGACLSMLCGLEGAIQGVRWHDLPEEKKKELKEFHKNL
ncbi:hypothetical protein MmiAt1_11510 [Methanimicrococcus sp. At1]|uniref:TfoX C-terminal domain-containing protein n=1 Tax=Methanimicrococcus hacksteinii TaxID=3028293 RepID=A0ABU3VQ73_9EURY|nr:TfoX/Sxy family protein [Methanimicrococcus sp. At1]MDV0445567.1 hypothetical protein [Methanimicrococcus sp. At1]